MRDNGYRVITYESKLMENIAKFKIGDKVEIVKYGNILWESKNNTELLNFPVYAEDDKFRYLDMSPELIGRIGIVEKVSITQGVPSYSIKGIGAWYYEDQMKKKFDMNEKIVDYLPVIIFAAGMLFMAALSLIF